MIPLTPAQLLQFLDAASATYTPKGYHEPTGPYYPFFEVAIWTGLRLGELLGLRWGDMDLTSTPAVLTVRRSSYKGTDVPTKSLASVVHHRSLPLVLGHEHVDTTMHYYVKAERLRDLLQTTHPTVIAIRQKLESLYQMARRRYETGAGL
jgi:integrase